LLASLLCRDADAGANARPCPCPLLQVPAGRWDQREDPAELPHRRFPSHQGPDRGRSL